MKLAVLFSGGKDSCLALSKAMQKEQVVCLVTIRSSNLESYMFHTPNIDLAQIQAERIGIPLILQKTEGEKEEELEDLRNALIIAKEKYAVNGVVTGAIASVYQASRVQRICDELDLWCFNPLWQRDQQSIVDEVIDSGFDVIISGVFAYPFDESWLGRHLDKKTSDELRELSKRYKLSPSGEGGEIETTVLNAPFFSKPVVIQKKSTQYNNHAGTLSILEVEP